MSKNTNLFNFGMNSKKAMLEDFSSAVVEREFYNLAISRFEWKGLPQGLRSHQVESYMYNNGCMAVFNMQYAGLNILPAAGTGELDINGRHKRYILTGLNGTIYEKSREEIALFGHDTTNIAEKIMVLEYVKRINRIIMTDDLNIKQLRVPFVFDASNNKDMSLKWIMSDIESNNPLAIYIRDNEMATQTRNTLLGQETKVQYLGDQLQNHIRDLYNRVYTQLGISNVEVRKAERLVEAEADANGEAVRINRKLIEKLREEGCKEVQQKFGHTITFKWAGEEEGESENVVQPGMDRQRL